MLNLQKGSPLSKFCVIVMDRKILKSQFGETVQKKTCQGTSQRDCRLNTGNAAPEEPHLQKSRRMWFIMYWKE